MSDPVRLFVYGTLMRGEANAQALTGSTYIGQATTVAAYRLVALDGYPGLLAGGQTSVKGELYLVDPQLLVAMDDLEGCPALFKRSEVQLAGGGSAQAYLATDSSCATAPTIAGGDWRQHRTTR